MFPQRAFQRAVVQASRRAFGSHAPAAEKPVLGMEKPSFSFNKRPEGLPGDPVRAPPVEAWSFNRRVCTIDSYGWGSKPLEAGRVVNEIITPPNPVGANLFLGALLGVLVARCCYVASPWAVRCGYARAGDERQAEIKAWYEARLLQGSLLSQSRI